MLAMVSDYRAINNQLIGLITTILTIFHLMTIGGIRCDVLERKTKNCLFFFLIYYTITSLFEFDFRSWVSSFMILIIVITPFFLCKYVKRNTVLMKSIVISFFLIWGVFVVLCYKTCSEIPDLARMMTSDRRSFIYILNGGGYPMGYGCAILVTYLYNLLIFNKIRGFALNLFAISGIIFMIITVLVINSFIILLSMLVGIIVSTINRISSISGSKIISYMLFLFIFIIFCFNIRGILNFLIEHTENDFWSKRWTETYASVVLGQNSNHVDTRNYVYQVSIDGFCKSPIVGNGYKFGNIFEKDNMVWVGNHSTFWDTLAQFGLIGGIPLFVFLLYPLRRARKDGEDLVYLLPFYIMLCLNPVLNCYHVMLIIYLIIPCLQKLINTDNIC